MTENGPEIVNERNCLMDNKLKIRMAKEEDAEELLAIYAPYVENTSISFEYEVPSIAEFQGRIRGTLEKYPYLVAALAETIVGYAYASSFHTRAAYGWGAEISIYVRMEHRGLGIGKRLYEALELLLKKQNILNVNACITYPNPGSVGFHSRMGFVQAAHFNKCGYKFDTWYDMIWMEKMLGEHRLHPEPVVPIGSLDWAALLEE